MTHDISPREKEQSKKLFLLTKKEKEKKKPK